MAGFTGVRRSGGQPSAPGRSFSGLPGESAPPIPRPRPRDGRERRNFTEAATYIHQPVHIHSGKK